MHSYLDNPITPSSGGDEEDRTPDPLRARQVLSQLSYIPVLVGRVMAETRLDQSAPRRGTWAFLDSNQRPHGYQPCALTN